MGSFGNPGCLSLCPRGFRLTSKPNVIRRDGNAVATKFTVRGTHTGTWLGIAPTGKPVEVDLCNIIEFRDGKVFRERDYLDTLGVFVQLGVVQMPSP